MKLLRGALLAVLIAGCADNIQDPQPSLNPDPSRPDIPTSTGSNLMWIHVPVDDVSGNRYRIQLRIDDNQIEHNRLFTGGTYDTLVPDGYHTVQAWAWDTASSGGAPKRYWDVRLTSSRDTTIRLQF